MLLQWRASDTIKVGGTNVGACLFACCRLQGCAWAALAAARTSQAGTCGGHGAAKASSAAVPRSAFAAQHCKPAASLHALCTSHCKPCPTLSTPALSPARAGELQREHPGMSVFYRALGYQRRMLTERIGRLGCRARHQERHVQVSAASTLLRRQPSGVTMLAAHERRAHILSTPKAAKGPHAKPSAMAPTSRCSQWSQPPRKQY